MSKGTSTIAFFFTRILSNELNPLLNPTKLIDTISFVFVNSRNITKVKQKDTTSTSSVGLKTYPVLPVYRISNKAVIVV